MHTGSLNFILLFHKLLKITWTVVIFNNLLKITQVLIICNKLLQITGWRI